MPTFYFTYGTDGQPFVGGWTEITAPRYEYGVCFVPGVSPRQDRGHYELLLGLYRGTVQENRNGRSGWKLPPVLSRKNYRHKNGQHRKEYNQ